MIQLTLLLPHPAAGSAAGSPRVMAKVGSDDVSTALPSFLGRKALKDSFV